MRAATSAQLAKMIRTIKNQIRVLNAASTRLPGKAGKSIKEHYVIIEEIEGSDAAEVQGLIGLHIRGEREGMLQRFLEGGGAQESGSGKRYVIGTSERRSSFD